VLILFAFHFPFLLIHNNFSWHHILKGKFLHGKRNRHADHLISILVGPMELHFKTKALPQKHGLEGSDLETQEHQNMIKRLESICMEHIKVCYITPYSSVEF
jgi:hypothetical protein